ncbi:MAG TPA: aldo/keto reductase [Terriglobia bacterium]|nr:aldo/keto reductase [Terriglobia bacterium]
MSIDKQSRRDFLGKVALGIAGTGAGLSLLERPVAAAGEMPYRKLGRSGEKVSLVGLGGFHIGVPRDEREGIRIIHAAIDNGINFMDNCWDYHDGDSEVRMGKALKGGYRQKAFLMTKIDGQVKPAAEKQLEESLRRLQVDTIDLLQFHEVVRMKDPDRIFGPNGAIETLIKAKKEGKIRYIGFTGHQDPAIHVKMLNTAFHNDFTFDAVQFPLNPMDPHYRSFEKNVVPILVEHGIGVLGMKPLGGGNLLKSGTVTPIECLHYAMNLPTSVVINGCDSMERLEQALTAARTFRPMTEKEVAALLAKTADAAKDGKFEPFKSTHAYNATDRHPEWLG